MKPVNGGTRRHDNSTPLGLINTVFRRGILGNSTFHGTGLSELGMRESTLGDLLKPFVY